MIDGPYLNIADVVELIRCPSPGAARSWLSDRGIRAMAGNKRLYRRNEIERAVEGVPIQMPKPVKKNHLAARR